MSKLSEREEQLYYIQHKWVPYFFYGATAPFVKEIATLGGQVFVDLLNTMNEDTNGYQCPYTADDFSMSTKIVDGANIIQIRMPVPTSSPLCRHIYLAYRPNYKERFVYTSELSPEKTFFLCGWGEDESHCIFDLDTPMDADSETTKVAKLFADLESYKNMSQKLKAQLA